MKYFFPHILLFLFSFLFSGCYRNCEYTKPFFKIINEMETNIDSILIIASSGENNADTLIFKGILAKKNAKDKIELKTVESDGSLTYRVYIAGQVSHNGYIDYFTNGVSLECGYYLNVKKDTVIVKNTMY